MSFIDNPATRHMFEITGIETNNGLNISKRGSALSRKNGLTIR